MNGATPSSVAEGSIGRRARDLIADGIAALALEDDSGLAHVPALYCPEVVAAIERRGILCLPYDFGWPSDGAWVESGDLAEPDRGVLLWFHPFGYRHRFPERMTLPARILVDACHALRTAALDHRLFDHASAAVLSPRKEFDLELDGIALDPRCPGERNGWQDRLPVDLVRSCAAGRAATRRAVDSLAGLIPFPGAGDILRHLPLRSDRRDEAIGALRAAGVPAWRWLESWTAGHTGATPRADRISAELLLVPVSAVTDKLVHDLDVIQSNRSLFKTHY